MPPAYSCARRCSIAPFHSPRAVLLKSECQLWAADPTPLLDSIDKAGGFRVVGLLYQCISSLMLQLDRADLAKCFHGKIKLVYALDVLYFARVFLNRQSIFTWQRLCEPLSTTLIKYRNCT